jgi:thiol-disulfide isomerase/thioredoxin
MGNAGSGCCSGDGGLLAPQGSLLLGAAEPLAVPPAAPDFAMVSVEDGQTITLHDLLLQHGGRPTVLQFYASWCGGSHKAADSLEQLSAEHGRHINFVHINVDSDDRSASNAEEFHRDHDIGRHGSFHFRLDRANDRLSAQLYSISYLPHRVILGQDGGVAVDDCREEWPDLAPFCS